MGSFTIELFENVPYHRANFIFLAKKGYFDNTMFHRVVKNFIIQGGNADNQQTAKKGVKSVDTYSPQIREKDISIIAE